MSERDEQRHMAAIVYAYLAAAALWLVIGSLYGVVLAWKLVYPDALTYELLSYGRIRPVHTASVLLGWLSLALTGLAYLVVRRTAERPIWSPLLAYAGLLFRTLRSLRALSHFHRRHARRSNIANGLPVAAPAIGVASTLHPR
jgi:cbb3-type cytochrome oxidase subunit 1